MKLRATKRRNNQRGFIINPYVQALPASSFATAVSTLGPKCWWRMEETTGTAIADSSGNSNDGTITGSVTLAQTPIFSGVSGSAYSTLGAGGYILKTGPVGMASLSAFTLACLVRYSTLTGIDQTPIGLGFEPWQGLIRIFADGRLQAAVVTASDAAVHAITTRSGLITVDTDYFLVMVYDGTGTKGKITLYINGAYVASTFCPNGASRAGAQLVAHMGQDSSLTSTYANKGRVDEALWFDKALTAAQQKSLATYLGLSPANKADYGADANWSSVFMLLQNDQAATDEADGAITGFDVVGNVTLSTVKTKFLNRSILFAADGGSLRSTSPSGINFGSSDWTIEGWYYENGTNQAYSRLFQTRDGDVVSAIGLFFNTGASNTDLDITLSADDSAYTLNQDTGFNLATAATWVHWAIVKSGTNVSYYKGTSGTGTRVASYTASSSSVFNDSAYKFIVGGQVSPARTINAYMECMRGSLVARYSGTTYTVPTGPFPNHA